MRSLTDKYNKYGIMYDKYDVMYDKYNNRHLAFGGRATRLRVSRARDGGGA